MGEEKHCPWGPSSLERLDKCPGSLRECEGLAEYESEDASRGTRIHEYASVLINGGRVDGADPEELEIAHKIADFAMREYSRIEGLSPADILVEVPLEFCEMPGAEPLYYGTSDLVCLDRVKKEVLVCDWKTGFKEVTEAANNLQGAAYALAAMQKYRMKSAHVIFFNPCINQLTEAWFDDPHALALEIGRIIARAKAPDAPRVPGEEQCRYCRAAHAGTCPAHLATCKAVCNLAEAPLAATWSDDTLAEWYERFQLASKFLEGEVKPEIIRRARENGECGGYEVKEQSGGRDARDICQAWVMLDGEMKQSDFLECCSLSVSKLKTLYSSKMVEAGKVKTKKEAGLRFEELLTGTLVDKPARVCLVKKGER